jgi:hypothetical protein
MVTSLSRDSGITCPDLDSGELTTLVILLPPVCDLLIKKDLVCPVFCGVRSMCVFNFSQVNGV